MIQTNTFWIVQPGSIKTLHKVDGFNDKLDIAPEIEFLSRETGLYFEAPVLHFLRQSVCVGASTETPL